MVLALVGEKSAIRAGYSAHDARAVGQQRAQYSAGFRTGGAGTANAGFAVMTLARSIAASEPEVRHDAWRKASLACESSSSLLYVRDDVVDSVRRLQRHFSSSEAS
jgi:hypothetical protein